MGDFGNSFNGALGVLLADAGADEAADLPAGLAAVFAPGRAAGLALDRLVAWAVLAVGRAVLGGVLAADLTEGLAAVRAAFEAGDAGRAGFAGLAGGFLVAGLAADFAEDAFFAVVLLT
jgi:hypothetical protein